ncbi:hypothetical protein QFC21_001210 [Naganishia friedmannii]|uniref:Uncharacterized protein n=1 Tax=Naganishia friedmannii TaxID=89922 RepID=A0ACC2W393_9TREE|nr:hypothetical protein QFC21_001210 [Naganishia friedmannii]
MLKKAKHEKIRFETESSDIPASEPARERYYEQQTKIRAIRKAARRQKGVEAEARKQTEGKMDMRAVQQGLELSDTDDEEPGIEGEYLVLSVTIGRRFTTTFGNELRIPVHQKLEIVNGHFKSFKMNTGIISPLIAMVHSTSDLGRSAEASLYEKANKLREDMDQFALKHSSEALDAVSCLGSANGNILSGSELQKQLVKAPNDDEMDQKT